MPAERRIHGGNVENQASRAGKAYRWEESLLYELTECPRTVGDTGGETLEVREWCWKFQRAGLLFRLVHFPYAVVSRQQRQGDAIRDF